jgi:hypothetical protein
MRAIFKQENPMGLAKLRDPWSVKSDMPADMHQPHRAEVLRRRSLLHRLVAQT